MAEVTETNHHVFTPEEYEQSDKFRTSFARWCETLGISFPMLLKDARKYSRTIMQFRDTPEGISAMQESPIMAGEKVVMLSERPTALQNEILKRALHEAHAAGLSDVDAGIWAGERLKERMPGKGITDLIAIEVYHANRAQRCLCQTSDACARPAMPGPDQRCQLCPNAVRCADPVKWV
jgi:hypothetical protein